MRQIRFLALNIARLTAGKPAIFLEDVGQPDQLPQGEPQVPRVAFSANGEMLATGGTLETVIEIFLDEQRD